MSKFKLKYKFSVTQFLISILGSKLVILELRLFAIMLLDVFSQIYKLKWFLLCLILGWFLLSPRKSIRRCLLQWFRGKSVKTNPEFLQITIFLSSDKMNNIQTQMLICKSSGKRRKHSAHNCHNLIKIVTHKYMKRVEEFYTISK